MSRPALVIFDLDGTLIDSRQDIVASTRHALAALGLADRTDAEVASYVGEGARKLIERAVAPRLDRTDAAFEIFMAHYGENLLARTRCYDGVPEMLRGFGATPLAVLTNKPGGFARRILQGLALADAFVAVLGGDEGPRKPDPALVLRLAELVAAPRERVVLVGDSRIDVATARAARVELVAVAWGFGSREELREAGARDDEVVTTPEALLARLTG